MKPLTKSRAQDCLNLVTPQLREHGVSDYVLRALAAQFGDLTVPAKARKKQRWESDPFLRWVRTGRSS